MRRRTLATLLLAAFAGGWATASTRAQSATQRYDVATIKPCPAGDQIPGPARGTSGGTNAAISPGRFNVPCVTAEQLIVLAYAGSGVRDDERLLNDGPSNKKVRGGPSWVYSYRDKWAIEATAPASATDRTVLMGSMLRTLLEERFKLRLHREEEQVDMFAMTIAKSGARLQPIKPNECDSAEGSTAAVNPSTPRCGSMSIEAVGPNAKWTMADMPMSSFVGRVASTLGSSVVDRTGMTGRYLIRLEFHPDDSTPGIKWPPERDADTSVPHAASIFTALEQQLGLRVERVKGPRGFIVIDHIEKP